MESDGRLIFDTAVDRSGLEAGLRQAQNDTSALSNTASVALGTLAGTAATKIVSTVKNAFSDASKFIVETGSQFEASMSQVSATRGITTAAEEYSILTEAAKKMGAETKYSATEAGNALNYLALAGYDAEKAVAALPTVLNVASAGGIDLATASDMITDSMSALGLEMNQLETFSDQLAKTSQRSNTSVAQLGEAILTVGGTAKSLHGGVAELNTMLGLIADNGIKGAEGGTALRNIILSLSAPTNTAAEALKRLNVSAFDSNGNMRELSEVFADLNKAMAPLTQEEKTQVLNEIFNKVDLKAVNALLGTTSTRFEELRNDIENCDGAAADMAKTMSDNLQGDIAIFNSSLEAVGNTAYESISGTLRTSIQSVTEVLGRLNTALDGEMGDRLGAVAEKLGDIAVKAAEFAVDEGIPKLIDALEWICDHDDELITAVETAGAMVIAYKGLTAANTAAKAIQSFTTAVAAATTAQEVFNVVLGACPAIAIGTAFIGAEIALSSYIESLRELIGFEGEVKEAYNQTNKEIALRTNELTKLANSDVAADNKKAYEESKKDVEEYTKTIAENTEKLKVLPEQVLEAVNSGDEKLADELTQEIDGLFEQNTFLENALEGRKNIIEKYSYFNTALPSAMGGDAAKRAEEEAKRHFGIVDEAEQKTAAAVTSQEELTKQLSESWTKLDHEYAMGIIKSDEELYLKRLSLLKDFGDESNSEHWKYYEQTKAYEKKQAEDAENAAKNLLNEKWSELDHQYNTGIIKDDEALYNERLKLLKEYGDESNSEHWRYYEQIYAYEKETNQKLLDEQKKLDEEAKTETENKINDVNKLYREQYNELLEMQNNYRQRLMAVGGSVFTIDIKTDENGQQTKELKINDIQKQIEDMKAYHEDIMKLKQDGASSALLAELNSVSAEDAVNMADYFANLSDSERSKIIELYKQKEAVANELSAALYADEAKTMQDAFSAALTDMGVGSYEAGVAAAEQFANGFTGTLSELIALSSQSAFANVFTSAGLMFAGGGSSAADAREAINVIVNVTGGDLKMDGNALGKYVLDYTSQIDVQRG